MFSLSARIVIGTVKGDLHDIGKNLVAMMVEGNGFEVIDLGVDVPPDKFVDAVKTNKADLCMMSALLTTTMPAMQGDDRRLQGSRSRRESEDHDRRGACDTKLCS